MQDYERKYIHLRMLINDIKLNCYKINLLTADALSPFGTRPSKMDLRLKDKLEQIEIINNDTELKIKECIEREFLF